MLLDKSTIFDKIIDEMSAQILREKVYQNSGFIMETHGREPTDYTTTELVEFYIQIATEIGKCQAYAEKYPDQPKTIEIKRDIIRECICDLFDPQAAWNVLRSQNPGLTAEEFKKMDPAERHNQFVGVLEQGLNGFRDLHTKRDYAIGLGKKENILPDDYR